MKNRGTYADTWQTIVGYAKTQALMDWVHVANATQSRSVLLVGLAIIAATQQDWMRSDQIEFSQLD